jgi:hypothetical protein
LPFLNFHQFPKQVVEVIDEILHEIVHHIQAKENREKEIIVCGTPKAKRMFGRKLEDRLKRGVRY